MTRKSFLNSLGLSTLDARRIADDANQDSLLKIILVQYYVRIRATLKQGASLGSKNLRVVRDLPT